MITVRSLSAGIAILVGLLIVPPVLAVDPDRSHYQYQFIYVPDDVDLPSDIVDIVQDGEGYLWLATSRGLARYDGLELTLYRVSDFPELLSNRPARLFVDSRDRLFIASQSGLSVYQDGEFRSLVRGSEWSKSVRVFAEDNAGTVFIGGDDGLWQFRDEQIEPSTLGPKIEDIYSLLWHDDKLVVGARGHIYFLANGTELAVELPADFSRSRVRDLAIYKNQVWAATRHGLLKLVENTAIPFRPDMFEGVSFNRLLPDRDDNLWFISSRNIGRILPNGETALPDVADETFGYVPEFTDILEDPSGQIWLSSRAFGLGGIRDTMVTRVSYSEGLSSPTVTSIAPNSDGRIFVATEHGIDSIDQNSASSFVADDFSNGASVRTMLVEGKESLWVGTQSGLRVYALEDGELRASPLGESEAAIGAIADGVAGSIWVATDEGLYEIVSGQIARSIEASGISINHLLFDQSGQLWMATENGIARLSNSGIEFVGERPSALSQSFRSLAELPTGEIVAMSADRGLAIYDGERWAYIRESNGLPAEQLIDVEVDGNKVWFITGSGVFLATNDLGNLGESHDINLQPVVTTSSYRGAHRTYCCRGSGDSAAAISNGKAYVATNDGVIYFDLGIPATAESLPVPYIKSISSDGVSLTYPSDEEHKLNWQSNDLRIQYSAIQLSDGDQVEFRYRLLGLSNDWVDNGSSRSVQFQNLPVGQFTFELQASLQPDIWNGSAGSYSFERMPRFIETKLFQLLIWVSIVALTVLLTWARMASARRRHKKLELQIQGRTQLLGDLNTELKSANRALEKSSQTDPLTGLTNRRLFDKVDQRQVLSGEIADSGIVMLIDIDFFKRVNDAYGHAAGDDILCQFSGVLRSCVRQSDLVIRWGGEEFVIICRCPNDDAAAMLERACDAVRQHAYTVPDGKRIKITCSIGAIRYPLWKSVSPNECMAVLMELADAALYEVKMSGRDGWAFLEDGPAPYEDPESGQVGPRLGRLIEADHLLWTSSKSEPPGSSLIDTRTRLRAIKSSPR